MKTTNIGMTWSKIPLYQYGISWTQKYNQAQIMDKIQALEASGFKLLSVVLNEHYVQC